MNFYLSAVGDMLKAKDDNRSIGIILCKTKNKLSVEYALRDTTKPMGIAEYKLADSTPTELKTNFPTIEEAEKGLGNFDLKFK
jgi:hypothetical protein